MSRAHRRIAHPGHAARRIEAGVLAGLGYWGESYVDAVMNKAKELWGEGQQATEQMLAEMRERVAQFERDWRDFKLPIRKQYYQELGLAALYDEVYAIGAKVERTIGSTVNAYRDLKSWMGLGLLPLVGAAVIAALIAAVAYYFTRRAEIDSAEQTRLAELAQVGKTITAKEYYGGAPQSQPSIFESGAKLAQWVVIGGIVGLIGYPLVKRYLR